MSSSISWRVKIFYSCGHISNDLMASVWFTYALMHFKFNFSNAGLLLFFGQLVDGISAPFIGFTSDKNFNNFIFRYGKRKIWHLMGTVLTTIAFPFIFGSCISCEASPEWSRFFYYASFIFMFAIGWASVQVSHVALITELTDDTNQRMQLNSYRQAGTVISCICIYSITLSYLGFNDSGTITKEDTKLFFKVACLASGIGLFFSILFHIFVCDPSLRSLSSHSDQELGNRYSKPYSIESEYSEYSSHEKVINDNDSFKLENNDITYVALKTHKNDELQKKKWYAWLKVVDFYKVIIIYLMARLFFNLIQVYIPLYLEDTLQMAKSSIAIIPFVKYSSGLIISLMANPISAKLGSRMLTVIGCIFGLISSIWILIVSNDSQSFKSYQIYGIACFWGMAGVLLLISGIALMGDLIGKDTGSTAFVFSIMGLFDKLFNGGLIALLEKFNPETNITNTEPIYYYRNILSGVTGSATICGLLCIASIWRTKLGIINK